MQCYCNVPAKQATTKLPENLPFYACGNTQYDSSTKSYVKGCPFFVKEMDLIDDKCSCGLRKKSFSSKDGKHRYTTCVNWFAPVEWKIQSRYACKDYQKIDMPGKRERK
jgi:hypothetical protein